VLRTALVLSICISPALWAAPAWGQRGLKARQLLGDGHTAKKNKQFDQAIEAYRMALDAEPALSEASDSLGRLLLKKKRYEDAAAVFTAAVVANPNYHKGFYRLGYALRKGGQLDDAAGAYEQYVKLRPHDPDGYYGLAETYSSLDEKELAVGAYIKYVKLERRPKEQKWVAKAKKKIVALGGKVPADDLALDDAAPAGTKAPAKKKITKKTKKAKKPAPVVKQTASGGVKRGDQAFSVGDYGTAIAAYRGAVKKSGADTEARYKLAVALVVRQELAEAEEQLLALTEADPGFDGGRRLLDRVRLRRSELAGRASAEPTGDAADLLEMAKERLAARDYALADQLLRQAHAGGADPALCDRLMGEALSAQGAFMGAADAYTRALGKGLEGLRAHRGLARVYEQLGDLRRAAYHLNLFLQLAPSEPSMGALEEADAERMLRSVEARLAAP
jgi:tetratricopeptide (TPR) repeat protein